MKKLLLVLSILSAVAFSSCNSMGEYEMPPTYGGQVIYSNVSLYHNISSEPANIAFRLMIWIKDGKKTDDDNYKKLFGNSETKIQEPESGVYTIKYMPSHESAYEYKKLGTIEINTYNTLLDNDMESWTISTVASDPLTISVYNMNLGRYDEYKLTSCNSSISSYGLDRWEVNTDTTIDCPTFQNTTPQLVWSGSNAISLLPATGEGIVTTFDKFVKGAVTVGVGRNESGSISAFNQEFTWEVDETLTYKMSCKQKPATAPFISKGVMSMTYDQTGRDQETFPSNFVEVSFEPIEDVCGAKGLLKYNGFQLSF